MMSSIFLTHMMSEAAKTFGKSHMPSIHSRVREYFVLAAHLRLLPLWTRGFLASHPALRIDVQSLPQGCRFLAPIREVRVCASHHKASCVRIVLTHPSPILLWFRVNASHLDFLELYECSHPACLWLRWWKTLAAETPVPDVRPATAPAPGGARA